MHALREQAGSEPPEAVAADRPASSVFDIPIDLGQPDEVGGLLPGRAAAVLTAAAAQHRLCPRPCLSQGRLHRGYDRQRASGRCDRQPIASERRLPPVSREPVHRRSQRVLAAATGRHLHRKRLQPSMTFAALRDSSEARCLRVGHSIVQAGSRLGELPARLAGAGWDMVELDVLTRSGELVVAHDPADLNHPQPIPFAEALAALRDVLPADTRFDVDVKATGYEHQVIEAVLAAELTGRTLVSTMELSSLKIIRAAAPELA